jgi:putative membrane protein
MKSLLRPAVAAVCALGLSTGAFAAGSSQTGNLPVPQDARETLQEMHQGNQKEIQLAQLALKKAQDPKVKELAQTILTDHQQADQKLQELAKSQKISLGTPKEKGNIHNKYEAVRKAYKDALTAVQGQPFDQLYATDMVLDHDKDVATLASARDHLRSNKQVSQYLDEVLPKLDHHRQLALDALNAVQPKLETGVGGSGQ